MFFEPPKVKSLSRYSEFGIYLQQRHFLMMVMVAVAMHASVIAIYAMLPHESVMRIPVRVLNIKLGSGPGDDLFSMPSPATVPGPAGKSLIRQDLEAPSKPLKADHVNAKNAQSLLDQALERPETAKNAVHVDTRPKPAPAAAEKKEKSEQPEKAEKTDAAAGEPSLSTPKRYVRTSDADDAHTAAAKQAAPQPAAADAGGAAGTASGAKPAAVPGGGGGGGGQADEKENTAIVERYEQAISLWIAHHKIYPEAAKSQGIEGDAVVRIRINRYGHILYYAIDRSSGNASIDAAVIAMVRSSDPVPSVPDNYPDASQLEFLIPVTFRLR